MIEARGGLEAVLNPSIDYRLVNKVVARGETNELEHLDGSSSNIKGASRDRSWEIPSAKLFLAVSTHEAAVARVLSGSSLEV